MAEYQLSVSREIPAAAQSLPPELQRLVRALCGAYETLDLRIETTFDAAENDFLAALPEIKSHEAELRRFVAMLIDDLRLEAKEMQSQPVLLHLAFQDESDLTQQLLSRTSDQGVEQ